AIGRESDRGGLRPLLPRLVSLVARVVEFHFEVELGFGHEGCRGEFPNSYSSVVAGGHSVSTIGRNIERLDPLAVSQGEAIEPLARRHVPLADTPVAARRIEACP